MSNKTGFPLSQNKLSCDLDPQGRAGGGGRAGTHLSSQSLRPTPLAAPALVRGLQEVGRSWALGGVITRPGPGVCQGHLSSLQLHQHGRPGGKRQ